MATELAKAYVQIVPSAKGISGSISKIIDPEAKKAGDSGGKSLGGSLVSGIKTVLAAAGIGAIVKQALDAGGALQQSFGGLDTIYGDASAAAKEYAAQAAAAGISMNDYAEQAVSFGASLKQAFEGDTVKAAEAANTAILDMADNAAKMGTPLESIQNAYQGFAKQNYTMLDNLKLGYGGTKTEMERLLKDAQAISGVKYDIENLGDVYDAIHVIQGELGLTGVAADEASGTFTGSMGAMKAAAENFLGSLTTGGNVTGTLSTLIDTAITFVKDNMLPMVGSLIEALPNVINQLATAAFNLLEEAAGNTDQMVSFAISFLSNLAQTLIANAAYLVYAAAELALNLAKSLLEFDWMGTAQEFIANLIDSLDVFAREMGLGNNLIDAIVEFISNGLPRMVKEGANIILNLVNGILGSLPSIIDSVTQVINTFLTTVLEHLPEILKMGFDLLMKFVEGILSNLPSVVNSVAQTINTFLTTVLEHLPEIFKMGFDLLQRFTEGIIDNFPAIVASVGDMIATFLKTVIEHLPEIVESAVYLLGQFAYGLVITIPEVIASIVELIGQIVRNFKDYDWDSIGHNLITGIKEGVVKAAHYIIDAIHDICERAWNSVKDFFGIESPSKLMRDSIGKNIALGWAKGLDEYGDYAVNAASDISNQVYDALKDPINASSSMAVDRTATINLSVVGEINGEPIMRLVNNGIGAAI